MPTHEPLFPQQRASLEHSSSRPMPDFHVVSMDEMPREAAAAVAEGRAWTGAQALEHKLVDALGTETTALQHAAD